MDEMQRATIAQQIRTARAARGWTQTELAKKAGVAPNTLGSIEAASKDTHPGTLRKVLDALGIEPEINALTRPNGVPDDVELVSQVIRVWLMAIPAGEARTQAVYRLMCHLDPTEA